MKILSEEEKEIISKAGYYYKRTTYLFGFPIKSEELRERGRRE